MKEAVYLICAVYLVRDFSLVKVLRVSRDKEHRILSKRVKWGCRKSYIGVWCVLCLG